MGEAVGTRGLSDAAGRPAADRLAARPALSGFARAFWRDESGATAIELGMIVALISVALIGIMGTLSGSLKTTFTKVITKLNSANAAS